METSKKLTMKKIIAFWDQHILKIGMLFLLFFIPLYPKLPLFDIKHTWVYIRLEDFFVLIVTLIFFLQLIRRKINLKNPLTLPIAIYWIVGFVSLANAIIFLSSSLINFFPAVAFLNALRRVEYMILLFITASSIKTKKDLLHFAIVFLVMVAGVIFYGLGQKFLGFPAFLTMNEEFAKGVPLYLPPEARMTSTFAGHYDLAAFMVFSLAFIGSLLFGFQKIWTKMILIILFAGSFVLLLFTASRISFIVYLFAITLMLILNKKKLFIIPILLLSLWVMKETSGTSGRFSKTFRVEPVVYDVRTGKAISTLQGFVLTPTPTKPAVGVALPKVTTTPPAPTPYEELPTGTGFLDVPLAEKIDTPLSKVTKTKSLFLATDSAQLATSSGEFLIKKAIVYDISFTTRFQGEWPRAIGAFKRNLLFGSGYSSISLATDNDYLRLLGETGVLGFLSFISILLIFLVLIKQIIAYEADPLVKSLSAGIAAGVFGIALNATLIDVFEASKVAYILWIMVGVIVGIYKVFLTKKDSIIKDFLNIFKQPLTAFILLTAICAYLFSEVASFNFTADDFTWLRWAATTKMNEIGNFFINSSGFFFRPLTKSLHFFLYEFLGVNPLGYHVVSLVVHLACVIVVYLIIRKITKSPLASFVGSLLFLIHPVHGETVFWVSGYSGILAAFFYFSAFYLFLRGREIKSNIAKIVFYLTSVICFALSLLSYEMAITLPLVILAAVFLLNWHSREQKLKKENFYMVIPYVLVAFIYFYLRNNIANAQYLSGDYNYNLRNFGFNFIGNLFGYLGQMFVGLKFIPFYDAFRLYFKTHQMIAVALVLVSIVILFIFWKMLRKKKINKQWLFAFFWFIFTLLPVIGLGNIAERYLYIPSLGFALFIGLFISFLFTKTKVLNIGLRLFANIILLIFIIATFNYYQSELIHVRNTWKEAGETANKILRALPTTYRNFNEGTVLYFVNLPLRIERAWVFPVGLTDGIWLIYHDSSVTVKTGNNLEEALNYKNDNANIHVFVFEGNQLKEAERQVEKAVK